MCEMELWNEKILPIPPINTYKAVNTNIDINHLHNVICEGKEFFVADKYMHAEYTVLSRIVYRMKQKFRSAKDFKALEKLNKALDNYFKMDIALYLQNFMDLMPSKYKNEIEIYLPTKNLLDYILVRLQGLVKLMERIVETSQIAAYLLSKRMQTGHFWKIAFIAFSLVSRVYVLARYTAKFVCDFYRKLLPFSNQLNNTGSGWLPRNYILPKDLREWLNVDWLEFDDEIQVIEVPTEIPDIMKFFDLVDDDDDVQFCDEYFMVDDDEDVQFAKDFKMEGRNKMQNTFLERLGELRGFNSKEDIGEIIEIEDGSQECNRDVIPINSEADNETVAANSEGNSDICQVSERKNVFPDLSIMKITTEDESRTCNMLKKTNRFLIDFNKSKSKDIALPEVLAIADSDSESSISESDEENVVSISDTSVIEASSDKVTNISEQNDSTINVETDEDIITILDTTSPQPAGLDTKKFATKNVRRNLKLNADVSKNDEDIIIVPDTPTLDAGVMRSRKRINKGASNLNGNVSNKIENREHTSLSFSNGNGEESVILDTPLKRLRKRKDKKIKGKVTKKVKKSKAYKKYSEKIKDVNKLEENITSMTSIVKISKSLKDKNYRKLKNTFLPNDTRGELENIPVLSTRKQQTTKLKNKIAKSKKKINNLKNYPPKLNTDEASVAKCGNLVTESRNDISPGIPLVLKKKKQKNKKSSGIENKQLKIKTNKKLQQNFVSEKKKNRHKEHSEQLPTGETRSQIKIARKKAKKKLKESNPTGIKNKNKRNSSPQNSRIVNQSNGFNMSESKKKKATDKNLQQKPVESKYFIKLQSETTVPQSNPLSTPPTLSNKSRKRKRYWEQLENKEKETNLSPVKDFNKTKRKNNKTAAEYKSSPDVALKTANVPSNDSELGTVVKRTNSEKRAKKRNKALKKLSRPSQIPGGKVNNDKHNNNNYHHVQKGKGSKNMRKDKNKKFKRKFVM